jgi:hypothetical protein
MKKFIIRNYNYNSFNNYILYFIIILILVSILSPLIFYFTSKFEKTIKIKDKFIAYVGRGRNYYTIIDTDNNIYRLINVWFLGDFNRIDEYARINIGDTYTVKGYGYNNPSLGMYKNIYTIKF